MNGIKLLQITDNDSERNKAKKKKTKCNRFEDQSEMCGE